MSTEALAERLFMSALGAVELQTIYLGDRLGFYAALHEGAATPKDLAARAQTNPRYTREWLEQQAVAGILTVDDAEAPPEERRYALPEEHAVVLTDPESPAAMAWSSRVLTASAAMLPRLVDAFRSGEGVPWEAYGPDMIEGQGLQNRPVFMNELGQSWLPAIPDVHERLTAGGRVADIATGVGWSAIGIARAYPAVTVDGFDLDEASIELARANAAEAGVADRVTFHATDAAAIEGGTYDLVTMFEALHDLPHPVDVLTTMKGLAGDTGAVVVMDERTAERFTAPGDELERFFYAVSNVLCLATSMTERDSAALGTVLRPGTLLELARAAGFSDPAVLDIEHDFFRFYRLQ